MVGSRIHPPQLWTVSGDTAVLMLDGREVLVDADDLLRAAVLRWYVMTKKDGRWQYVRATGGGPFLHRWVLGLTDVMVDHINLNTFDNRRANLRLANRSQNGANVAKRRTITTSRFKGVSWNAGGSGWRAQITAYGRSRGLGRFDNEEDAARAYDAAAIQAWGEFARTNADMGLFNQGVS